MSIAKNTPNFLKHSGLSFTTIINQTMNLIEDAGALGIYCYLSSKSENWEICNEHLANRFNVGREYIEKRMKILKELGLVETKAFRDKKGKITHWETNLVNFVAIQNTEKPCSGEKVIHKEHDPEYGKTRIWLNQSLEKQALLNKRKIQIKEKIQNKRERSPKKSFCPGTHELIISEEAKKICNEKKLNIIKIGHSFMAHAKANGWLRVDWKAAFLKWVIDEKVNLIKPSEKEVIRPRMRDFTQERLDREAQVNEFIVEF